MKHRVGRLFSCLAAALAGATGGVRAQQPAPARIDSVFAAYDYADSPGCALGVVRGDRLVYSRGYGSADLDYRIPLSDSSVFYMASVSKQFTAAAILMAARQGYLSLDDDIHKYLPQLPDYGAPITIGELIHHTSGLRDYLTLMPLAGMRLEDVHPDAEVVDLIARQRELNFPPGDQYLYSNTGYFLLAEIIQRATGKSLRQFAQENLFTPLGMTHTHFHDDMGEIVPNRVIAYGGDREQGFRITQLFNFDKVGSGGLYSTVADLLLWDRAFYDGALGADFFPRMLQRGVLNNGDTLAYAFGLTVGRYRGLPVVEHGGSMMGFKTYLLRFPEQHFSVITLCNLGSIDPGSLSHQVADLYLGNRMGPAPAVAPPATAARPARPERTGPAERGPETLKEYVGTYYSDELNTTYTISVRDNWLVVSRRASPDVSLSPGSGRDTFRAPGLQYDFTRDAAGHVTGFVLQAGRVRNLHFSRQ